MLLNSMRQSARSYRLLANALIYGPLISFASLASASPSPKARLRSSRAQRAFRQWDRMQKLAVRGHAVRVSTVYYIKKCISNFYRRASVIRNYRQRCIQNIRQAATRLILNDKIKQSKNNLTYFSGKTHFNFWSTDFFVICSELYCT